MPADEFITSFESSQDAFISEIEELEDQGLSIEEILAILAATNMAAYIIEELQMGSAVASIDAELLTILDDLPFFGTVSETQLAAFRNMVSSSVMQFTESLGTDMRNVMMQGITNGLPKDEIRDMMRRTAKGRRVENIINDALRTFEQSVIAEMARGLPGNTPFSYVGPLDEKTRPLCRHILASSPLTRQQIDSRFPGAFLDRGGYNCRHMWLPNEPVNKQQRASARESVAGATSPKTLKEYYASS